MARQQNQLVLAVLLAAGGLAVYALAGPRVWAQQTIRPEVIIVLDTSGSMNLTPPAANEANLSGSDCGGDRENTVDLCGDGVCTGLEDLIACPDDCNILGNGTSQAGMAPACKNDPSRAYTRQISRMFMVKRVLRNVLPALRDKINAGLVTFRQDGYFQYFPADSSSSATAPVTVFYPRLQLELMGVWDTANAAPQVSFVREGTSYTLLSTAGLLSIADSLYRNANNPADEHRFPFSVAGLTHVSGTTTWQYVGSYYTYDQRPLMPSMNGVFHGWSACTTSSPCAAGEADCADNNNATCQAGLRCFANIGPDYWSTGEVDPSPNSIDQIDVCEPLPLGQYRGPQFTEGGLTWVYRRFTWGGWSSATQRIFPVNVGQLVVPLATSDDQAAVDASLLQVMVRMNLTTNGGILAVGNTPTGPAIQTAAQHFQDRTDGTGPFTAVGADRWAFCRGRFVLLLTDGESNVGIDPEDAAQELYQLFPDNPVKTLVVALPGLPAAHLGELQRVADMGDNALADSSAAPFLAQDEAELVQAIESAMALALGGEGMQAACVESCDETHPCEPGYICLNNLYCVPATPTPDGGPPTDAGILLDGAPTPDLLPAPDTQAPPDQTLILDGQLPPDTAVPDAPPPLNDGAEVDQTLADSAPADLLATSDSAPGPDQANGDGGPRADSALHGDANAAHDDASAVADRGSSTDRALADSSGGGGDSLGPPTGTDDGCNCSVSETGSWPLWPLGLLGLILLRRRQTGR